MVHYALVFIIVALLRLLWEVKTGKQRVVLPWSVYMKRVLPTGEIVQKPKLISHISSKKLSVRIC